MLVVGLTGLQGAGKSFARAIAKEQGFATVDADALIRQRLGTAVTYETIRAAYPTSDAPTRASLRETIIAAAQRHIKNGADRLIIDAVYSPRTREAILTAIDCRYVTLAIYAPPTLRRARIQERARSDDNTDDFAEKDHWMLSLGIGETFALADFLVPNTTRTEEYATNLREAFTAMLAP